MALELLKNDEVNRGVFNNEIRQLLKREISNWVKILSEKSSQKHI